MVWTRLLVLVLPAMAWGQMFGPQQPFPFPAMNGMGFQASMFPFAQPQMAAGSMNPQNPMMAMMMGMPPAFPSFAAPQQRHAHALHAGRPSAPDVSEAAKPEDQSSTKEEAKSTSLVQSYASTMLGSLQTLGHDTTAAAHQLFVPPYSWMWRVAMTLASTKYDNVDRIADVPELMNLITGYYAGSPDAIAAAKNAEKGNDRFSLLNLPHLLQGPATYAKEEGVPDSTPTSFEDDTASSGNPGGFASSGSSNDIDNFDEDEDMPKTNGGLMSTLMNSVMGGSESKPVKMPAYHPTSSSSMTDFMAKMMNGGSKSKSMVSPDMIKMMGNMVGANPALVNMAAPMIGSML